VLAAWSALTAGIGLGSFWAYYELGWGGFWFWDAVENAAFMPWLLGTALIHSLAVAEKRPGFLRWSLLLALLAFSLSLLGTFLVRSSVVSSVHAFASDPARGLFILVLLAVSVGGSLSLFAWRAAKAPPAERFAVGSRESLLMLNNLLLATATGTVLLGTLYPLAAEVLGGVKLSVGAPYFDTVFPPLMLPLMLPLVVLMVSALPGAGAGDEEGERGWRRGAYSAGRRGLGLGGCGGEQCRRDEGSLHGEPQLFR